MVGWCRAVVIGEELGAGSGQPGALSEIHGAWYDREAIVGSPCACYIPGEESTTIRRLGAPLLALCGRGISARPCVIAGGGKGPAGGWKPASLDRFQAPPVCD